MAFQTETVDDLFARYGKPYRVLVTADHGFTDCGYHGGTSDDVRDVAFYDIGHPDGRIASDEVSQRAIAPTVLAMLGLVATPCMTEPTLV